MSVAEITEKLEQMKQRVAELEKDNAKLVEKVKNFKDRENGQQIELNCKIAAEVKEEIGKACHACLCQAYVERLKFLQCYLNNPQLISDLKLYFMECEIISRRLTFFCVAHADADCSRGSELSCFEDDDE